MVTTPAVAALPILEVIVEPGLVAILFPLRLLSLTLTGLTSLPAVLLDCGFGVIRSFRRGCFASGGGGALGARERLF